MVLELMKRKSNEEEPKSIPLVKQKFPPLSRGKLAFRKGGKFNDYGGVKPWQRLEKVVSRSVIENVSMQG